MKTHRNSRLLALPMVLVIALLPLAAMAQGAKIKMPDFSALSKQATEVVDVDLDHDMLQNAAGFMSGKVDDPQLLEQIKGLKGITVKVFSFDKPDAYSMSDIEPMVKQVQNGGWKKLVSVRDKQQQVQMWMRDASEDGGMFFVAAEPRKLVLINIVGKVDLAMLSKLQGRMGMPNMGLGGAAPAAPVMPAAPAEAMPPAPPAK